MYERPFATEYFDQRKLFLQERRRARLKIRAAFLASLIIPSALGIVTGHPYLGFGLCAVSFFTVALVAFGYSVLDGTIELY